MRKILLEATAMVFVGGMVVGAAMVAKGLVLTAGASRD
jgi:hypothetical protein